MRALGVIRPLHKEVFCRMCYGSMEARKSFDRRLLKSS